LSPPTIAEIIESENLVMRILLMLLTPVLSGHLIGNGIARLQFDDDMLSKNQGAIQILAGTVLIITLFLYVITGE